MTETGNSNSACSARENSRVKAACCAACKEWTGELDWHPTSMRRQGASWIRSRRNNPTTTSRSTRFRRRSGMQSFARPAFGQPQAKNLAAHSSRFAPGRPFGPRFAESSPDACKPDSDLLPRREPREEPTAVMLELLRDRAGTSVWKRCRSRVAFVPQI